MKKYSVAYDVYQNTSPSTQKTLKEQLIPE